MATIENVAAEFRAFEKAVLERLTRIEVIQAGNGQTLGKVVADLEALEACVVRKADLSGITRLGWTIIALLSSAVALEAVRQWALHVK